MVVVSTITSQENLGFESTGKSFCVVFACSACPSPGTPGSSHSHGRCVMLIGDFTFFVWLFVCLCWPFDWMVTCLEYTTPLPPVPVGISANQLIHHTELDKWKKITKWTGSGVSDKKQSNIFNQHNF